MALANTIGLVPRDPNVYHPQGDLWSVGAYGELVIGGGTAFTSASNPSAEVIKGTGVALGRSFRVTGTVSTGLLTVTEAGDYIVELDIFDRSEGAASGNVQFDVQYAPDGSTFAAFSTVETEGGAGRMQAIRLAATSKNALRISKVQRLNAGSAVRAIVTSAAGNVCTVTEGVLRVRKVADVDPPSA